MDASLPRDNAVMAEAETDSHGVDKDEYFYDDDDKDNGCADDRRQQPQQQQQPDPAEEAFSSMFTSPVNRRPTDLSLRAVVVTHDNDTTGRQPERSSRRPMERDGFTTLSGSRRRLFEDTAILDTPSLPPSQRQRVEDCQRASATDMFGTSSTNSTNSSSYSYSGNEITQSQTLLYATPPPATAAIAASPPTFRDIPLGHVPQPQMVRARLVATDMLRFRTGAVLSLHFVDANRDVFNAVCFIDHLVQNLYQAAQPGIMYNVQCQDKTTCLDAKYRLLDSIGTVTLYERHDMTTVVDNNDRSTDRSPHPLLLDVQQRDPLRRQVSSLVYTRLDELGNATIGTKDIHLLAVVKQVGVVATGKRKDDGTPFTRCELSLVDDSGECKLTIWGNLASSAATDYAHQPIVAFGNVTIGEFWGSNTCSASKKGTVLNAPMSGSEPRRYPQVEALQQWWNDLVDDAPERQTTVAMAWDERHNWGQLAQSYPLDFDHFGAVSTLYRRVCIAPSLLEETRVPPPTIQLNQRQSLACAMILDLVESSGMDRLGILIGRGGTGKSAVIAAAEYRLQTPAFSHGRGIASAAACATVLKMAPTGIAASVIGGSTLHSALNIPFAGRPFVPLSVDRLIKLKSQFYCVQLIVIDEFSMLKQRELVYIESRLREVGQPNQPFGGFAVLLAGDPAQLSPLGGQWVWEDPKPNATELGACGKELYGMFQKVVELTEVMRLESASDNAESFVQVLDNLRNGTMTDHDHAFLIQKCSKQGLGPTTFAERFPHNDPSITHLYLINTLVEERNMRHLQLLQADGMPITLLQAVGPKGQSNDKFFGLEYKVYLAVGAKVAMVLNLCPRYGLVNGASGVVMDIVYKPGVAPPELPLYVWVDFGSLYTGPSFFRGNNPTWRRGWVPVHAETRNGRTAIPLRLAFAWTVWKAQGQTFHGKVLADLGAKERAHGLIYTALSRVTKLEHLGIQNGVPRDQCDGVPDKMACRKNEEARLRRLATATMERLEQRRER